MLLVVQPHRVRRALKWGCSVGKGQHLQSECHVCSQTKALCVRRGACCCAVTLSSFKHTAASSYHVSSTNGDAENLWNAQSDVAVHSS